MKLTEKLIHIDIDKLIPYVNNARTHSKEQIVKLRSSLREFGFVNPVLIDSDNNIIAGHGRVIASKEEGIKKIPCILVEHLTDAQKKAYILADNRLALDAGWDMELLNLEIESLKEMDFDISLTGFEMDDLTFGEDEVEVIEDDFDTDKELGDIVEPISKRGDVWLLGEHRLMCGDSTFIDDVEKLMDGKKADMVFTDPPYKIETEGGCIGNIGASLRKQDKEIEFISDFNPMEFLNVLPGIFEKNKINAYVFCNKELLPEYLTWARDNKYSFNVLVWKKPNAIPIGDSHRPDIEYLLLFRRSAIWNNGLKDVNYSRCLEFGRESGLHPTMKPIELIINEIKISSNKSSNVVDLFGGSGSTLIACEQTNRKCYMMELDEKYCDVIIKRWETLTGKKAELIVG